MTDFTPSNPLEQALLDASRTGSSDELFELLATEQLYLPAQGDAPAEGEAPLTQDDELELPVFEHEGERFVPVFTSVEQLQQGAPGAGRYVRASGADLASVWPAGHHLALNPGGDLSVAIGEEDVRGLAGQGAVPDDAEVTIGSPAEEPQELWDRLRAWAREVPEVLAAHRALVLVHAPGEEPQLVVALDLDPSADPGRILNAGADELAGEAAFTLLDRDGDDPLSAWMMAQGQPLYTRGQG
ncbi:MAG TPA: enhanced serine sensitivity protein SseB C-terminal domain-containing protein [Capillimicrobium sp.]